MGVICNWNVCLVIDFLHTFSFLVFFLETASGTLSKINVLRHRNEVESCTYYHWNINIYKRCSSMYVKSIGATTYPHCGWSTVAHLHEFRLRVIADQMEIWLLRFSMRFVHQFLRGHDANIRRYRPRTDKEEACLPQHGVHWVVVYFCNNFMI